MQTLQNIRRNYVAKTPIDSNLIASIDWIESIEEICLDEVKQLFALCAPQKKLQYTIGEPCRKKMILGVVFSGGQAPGGHSVIAGVFDALEKIDPESILIGFLDGPQGLIDNKYTIIDKACITSFCHQGGFDMLGSGRRKITTEDDFQKVAKTVLFHKLDACVIIGGDDSNTNAAYLAEFFLKEKLATTVVGIPKTIDGDLRSPELSISFGFDTATKTYASLIGNIALDARSAKKYYYFIKVMGRSASHVALECALRTNPNYVLIGEEIRSNKKSLQKVVQELADLVVRRREENKNYGIILIPEGVIESFVDVEMLIQDIERITMQGGNYEEKKKMVIQTLSSEQKQLLEMFSEDVQKALFAERDSHGNLPIAQIETERLLIQLVDKELKKRSTYKGGFTALPIFLGYEGRCAFPSNFDVDYAYTLGLIAVSLALRGKTGYMAAVQNLHMLDRSTWQPCALGLLQMLQFEERKGKRTAVIQKALVDCTKKTYKKFLEQRALWELEDAYCSPGPIQFFGPSELIDTPPYSLSLESS